MSLSVVILSANSDNLKACVAFVRRNEPDIDIIVVDDGAKSECDFSPLQAVWR